MSVTAPKIPKPTGRKTAWPRDDDECYVLLGIEFNIALAIEMIALNRRPALPVATKLLASALASTRINEKHVGSVDCDAAIIIGTLPRGYGTPVLDGHHRIAKALKTGRETLSVYTLSERETKAICYTPRLWRLLTRAPKN